MPVAHQNSRDINHSSSLSKTFPGDYNFIQKLQDGAEGQVQEWSDKRTGHLIAVKVMKRKEHVQPREVIFLSRLPENDSTVRCLAFFDKTPMPDECCIILEHCAVGDLYNFYWNLARPKNNAVFSETFMWSMFSQLADALAFLHEGVGCKNPSDAAHWRPVIHRDIKMENILVTTTGSMRDFSSIKIKLADFGMAAFYDPHARNEEYFAGTPCYWAPEVTWDKRVGSLARSTPATDVWAIGAVMHFFAHGLLPIESPEVTKRRWLDENAGEEPCRHGWFKTSEDLWWPGVARRQVLSINVEYRQQPRDDRKRRPTPKYSDALNHHLMTALSMTANERPEAGKLARHLKSAYSDFVFAELRELNAQETRAAERRETSMSPN